MPLPTRREIAEAIHAVTCTDPVRGFEHRLFEQEVVTRDHRSWAAFCWKAADAVMKLLEP